MNEDKIEGAAKTGFGKLESTAGDALGDDKMQVDGAKTQIDGKVQDVIGKVSDQAKDVYGKVSVQAKDVYGKVSDQAKDVYGKVSDHAKGVAEKVDPFVNERPYAALAIAAGVGLVIGHMLSARGPKILYVRE